MMTSTRHALKQERTQMIFNDFDFRLLDDPEFREDSVREELIVPLLSALGFSASPPYRIIRSKPLEHPYVYIGTVKKGVSIIPDYLLERDGRYAWILDAKAPNENIDSGKNVEQAYSYAIHKDIRVPLYSLCNGRKLIVFGVNRGPAVIDISLQEIEGIWPMVLGLLGCRSAWPHGIPPGFQPDMGLAMVKAGLMQDDDGKKFFHIVTSVHLTSVARVEDNLYCISGTYRSNGDSEFAVTFDFGPATLEASTS
jgi:Type I restriction enzyme R protein N terminus (HSDR_N)